MKAVPIRLLLCSVLALMLSGCFIQVRAPVVPPIGYTYNETEFPVDIEFGPNDIGQTKGTAMSKSVLGCVSWGDASIQTAARNAGIQQIDHVDSTLYNILGVYTEYEVVVYGKTAEQLKTPAQ